MQNPESPVLDGARRRPGTDLETEPSAEKVPDPKKRKVEEARAEAKDPAPEEAARKEVSRQLVRAASMPKEEAPTPRLLLAIEGNIGIGKSTLLNKLKQHYRHDSTVVFVDEPVDTWEEKGLLAAMYEDKISRCTFQLMALATRYGSLLNALSTGATTIITERSVFSDRACFAKVNLEQGSAGEDAYAAAHDALCAALPAGISTATVLLEAPRAVLNRRIAKRGREAEGGGDQAEGSGIPDAYLDALDAAHVAYYEKDCEPAARRRVDATATPDAVCTAVLAAIDELTRSVPKEEAVTADDAVTVRVAKASLEKLKNEIDDAVDRPLVRAASAASAASADEASRGSGDSSSVSSWSQTVTEEFFQDLVEITRTTTAYRQLDPYQKAAFHEYIQAHRADIDEQLHADLKEIRKDLGADVGPRPPEETLEKMRQAIKARLEKVAGEVAARPEVLAGSTDLRATDEEFFQQFVREMLAKPWYLQATAAQKAMVAEKIQLMKPHVLEEFKKIQEQGGKDYALTAADVKNVLATVMSRLQQSRAAGGA
jgi:deoxyadenosine/deoxycytidine kinase